MTPPSRLYAKASLASKRHTQGIVLLAILFALALTALGATALIELQQTQMQRAKEQELLFVGDQYRKAIRSYYSTTPAGRARSLPSSLDDLLEDKRFTTPVRHLRRLYPDPMTGETDWALVSGAGGIIGVHSQSTKAPLNRRDFLPKDKDLQDKSSYAEWLFVAPQN